MPGGSKKAADAALIAHLAAGVSPAGAAKLAGVSEATVFRRLASGPFRERVEKARSDFWDRALGIMSKGATESAIVLRKLLRSDDSRIKLQAAKSLLETGMKVREVMDLARQMEELRMEMEQLKPERENDNAWDRFAALDAATDGVVAAVDGGKAEDEVKPLFDADGDMGSDIKPLFDG